MIRSVIDRLRRPRPRAPAAPPAIPPDMRIYAVGDIHGRFDLLQILAGRIADDLAGAPTRQALTVFLGDYIDRGPRSAAVLEALSGGEFPTRLIALRGNHEEMLLRFLDDGNALESWRGFGGLETLHSYGVPVADAMRGAGYAAAREAFARALPQRHLDFLNGTAPSVAFGDYFFCHAGVRPGVALDRQRQDDLLWIRHAFLQHRGSFGKVVVHGHTPVAAPEDRGNRINIDTGAYASATLTALVLEGDRRRYLSTRPA
jgi:serine/threonine protein phosphatase 1